MTKKQLLTLVVTITGLTMASWSRASQDGPSAEEIWSENFCEQAVALARQQGEKPETLNLVNCRLLNYYQPSYWQCVIAAMKTKRDLKLDAARAKCLAEY